MIKEARAMVEAVKMFRAARDPKAGNVEYINAIHGVLEAADKLEETLRVDYDADSRIHHGESSFPSSSDALRRILGIWVDRLGSDDLYKGWFLRATLQSLMSDPEEWEREVAALRGTGERK